MAQKEIFMNLEEKIEKDLVPALKAHDAIKVSTLRMLKADINNTKIKINKNSLNDNEVLGILSKQVKQHKDSIEQFEKGKREDLVEKEKKELEILLTYMPKQLSEEELKRIIDATIKELGATTKKDMGNVIKSVMDKAKGQAEGKIVSKFVADKLA
jgi:uncharacterized protein